MKIVYAGTISTALILVLGIALVIPVFLRFDNERPTVMLVFSVANDESSADWLASLSTILNRHNIPATVFVTGKFASSHPECIDALASDIDVGSQTYSYAKLTSISDYVIQLEEIREGKNSVDTAGKLDSRLFRAPFGATDDNIYSLLNRSGILADFSYTNHYNKFYNGQFIRFDIESYNGTEYSADYFSHVKNAEPVMIYFDSTTPVTRIDEFIIALKSSKGRFVNASEITGLLLTVRLETEI